MKDPAKKDFFEIDQEVPDDRRPRHRHEALGEPPAKAGDDVEGEVISDGGEGDGRVSRAARLRQERRLQVMKVALRLFAERGYHQTSIQDILDGAAIARGTFYLYFDSKRAIFDELVDDFLRRIRAVVRRVDLSPGAEAPLAQIEQNLSRVMAILLINRDLAGLALRLADGMGIDRECDSKMTEFYDRLLTLLGGALTSGQRMGLVRPCDTQVVAQAALGSLKEVVLHWIVSRESTPAEIEHVTREILLFSLRGLFIGPGPC